MIISSSTMAKIFVRSDKGLILVTLYCIKRLMRAENIPPECVVILTKAKEYLKHRRIDEFLPIAVIESGKVMGRYKDNATHIMASNNGKPLRLKQ